MKLAVFATVALGSLACAAAFAPGFKGPASASRTVALNMASADFVEAEIGAHDIVVFSKSYCPFCTKTKDLFDDLKVEFTSYELNQMDDGADIQSALSDKTGQSTVPSVFIKGEHIGGNSDLQALAGNGKLQKMLGL
mmetsp:Transcript_18722/g.28437  ORF Transcript_18722/g.28437 Transcript_18722/m.28437 type:complete len:137 (-) Transcript_18722:75-485(-)|eukprot:CAMPEP_0194085790 /NCGR_PEP_ID=MMETSP0149-20130528/18798_1 /TAXON_ID=122233 /ORGANISM="Chaetoceros debilis, Strain MM31A-1" /LENGTH=136 /DNA_ID=CAMNT_0038768749 /DNA_START=58 /DNA_END=468 /DNA_ORIENTATION=+